MSANRRVVPLSLVLVIGAVALETACDDASHAEAHDPHWSYEAASGPAAWGDLSADYRLCSAGTAQSPIDLASMPVDSVSLPPLRFVYERTSAEELDNGHTIEDEVPAGQSVVLGDRQYSLRQFHFHHPSEHARAGRHAPMEMHLVHRDSSGALLVVAVFVEEGAANAALGALFDTLPPPGTERIVSLDLRGLLPPRLDYLTYQGSLTTPPCSEGVTWVILGEPLTASPTQLAAFAARYDHNNRPVVTPNGRHLRVPRAP